MHKCIFVIAIFVCVAAVRGQTLPAQSLSFHPPLAGDTGVETHAVIEKLLAPQSEFTVENKTLRDVTTDLAAALKINLVVQWPELLTINVTQTTAISLSARHVSYHQALRLMLDQAAPEKLDYIVSEGVLEIHTREWLERHVIARVYDLSALTKHGFYSDPPAAPAERGEALASLANAMVTPDLWNTPAVGTTAPAHDGPKSVCKLVAGQLAIIAPLRAQQEAGLLMESLRRPIRLPTSKAQVAANNRAGFPVELPARLKPLNDVEILTPLPDPPADVTIAVYDLRDLARRAVFLSNPNKPTAHDVVAKLLTTIAEQSGSSIPATTVEQPRAVTDLKNIPIVREYEGLLVVRATPEGQRKIATVLSTLAR